jgi:hypothetical protein
MCPIRDRQTVNPSLRTTESHEDSLNQTKCVLFVICKR